MFGSITAYSTPDYDMPFNRRVVEAWQDQSFWNWSKSWYKYDNSFVNYFESQGLDASHTLSRIVNNAGEVVETVTGQLPAMSKVILPLVVVGLAIYAFDTFKN
jgi:hypothetical protein